jgi:hypothetical protein
MPIAPAPARLIDAAGRPRLGVFSAPIADLNYRDFIRPGASRPVPLYRIKRWLYLGVVSPEFIVGAAVVSLHLVGNVFFYVFDRRGGKLIERSFLAPLCRGINFDSNGIAGEVSFARGSDRLTMRNDRRENRHLLSALVAGVRVEAEFEDRQEPLACVTRTGFSGFNYTLKLAGLPVTAELEIGGAKSRPAEAFGVLDYTTGCLARETFWNWAAGGGRDAAGNVVGINLVQGVNDTGFTENAFWIGDRLVKVDSVSFDYDDRKILDPWRLRSWDGRVDLGFTPEGERKENVNALLIASRFHQPFGEFRGTLRDEAGVAHEVSLSGYTEEHYALW